MAIKSNRHVYLEKPMAITSEGCDRIMDVAAKSGRILYVGHNLRHFTVIRKLKELIENGYVGEVKAIWCQHFVSYGHWAYFKRDRWHQKIKNTGSLLIHKGAHDFDVIHWFAGSYTKRVTAMGKLAVFENEPGNPDVEDYSVVQMMLPNGVLATYNQCHFAHLACREYTIIGTKGTIRNKGDDPKTAVVEFYQRRKLQKEDLSIPTQKWSFEAEEGFHGNADGRIVKEFIGVIQGITPPSTSIEDAAAAVKTAYAATHSLRNGNIPVEVN